MDDITIESMKSSIENIAELSMMFWDSLIDMGADEDKAVMILSVFMGTILYHE